MPSYESLTPATVEYLEAVRRFFKKEYMAIIKLFSHRKNKFKVPKRRE